MSPLPSADHDPLLGIPGRRSRPALPAGDREGKRQRSHLNILALRHNGNVDPMFGPSCKLEAGDRVILLGSDRDVQKFLRF